MDLFVDGYISTADLIKTIGKEAFAFTTNLTNISLPENLEVIEQSAFERSGLVKLIIPFNVTDIQARAFARSALREAKLEPTSSRTKIIDIPANAWFYDCSKNTIIYIDNSIMENASEAFGDYWNYYSDNGTLTYLSNENWTD